MDTSPPRPVGKTRSCMHRSSSDSEAKESAGETHEAGAPTRANQVSCLLEGLREFAAMKKYCILGLLVLLTLVTSLANVYLQEANPAVIKQELERMASVAQNAASAAVSGDLNQLLTGASIKVNNTEAAANLLRDLILGLVRSRGNSSDSG